MKVYLELEREEIKKEIPYALICETMGGSRWNTMRRKRLWKDIFTESEKRKCSEIYKHAHKWYLVKGVPDTVKMTYNTLRLWHKLGEFCAAV